MTLTEEICAQAALLAGDLSESRGALLELLCREAEASLSARLKEGLTAEDCREAFVAAASLSALAGLGFQEPGLSIAQFQAGDLSVKHSTQGQSAALESLAQRARRLMAPYLKDPFQFAGV